MRIEITVATEPNPIRTAITYGSLIVEQPSEIEDISNFDTPRFRALEDRTVAHLELDTRAWRELLEQLDPNAKAIIRGMREVLQALYPRGAPVCSCTKPYALPECIAWRALAEWDGKGYKCQAVK